MCIKEKPPPAAVEESEASQEVEAHALLQMFHFPYTPALQIVAVKLGPNKNPKVLKYIISNHH